MKYLITLILCLPVGLAAGELITVQVGNTQVVLDVVQGDAESALEIIQNNIDAEGETVQGDKIKITQGTQEVVVKVVAGDKDALIEAVEEKTLRVGHFIRVRNANGTWAGRNWPVLCYQWNLN